MSQLPSDQNDAPSECGKAHDRIVDAAEVIRRLDNLWVDQSAFVAAPFSSAVGTTVGRYVLERIIGRGAFGVVYRARDPDLNRSVAIKIPRPDVLLDSDHLARFEREVQACARLDHPGIVPLYEADLLGAVPYMASAYCPGPNLQQWIDESAVPCLIEDAVSLIEKVARAVQYAHENGVVHRDLKPANILLVPNDAPSTAINTLNHFQPRLTDFGLAHFTHELHQSQSSLIIGTPLYMSPEQAESRADDVGPCSDIFGLAAILYHLLTGAAPFAARNYAGVLLRLREETPVPVSVLRSEVDADLETVCMKGLQRDPADRYSSADALADDLRQCLNGQPIQGQRMSLIQRVRIWSRQSARVHEATMLIVVLACLRLIFAPGGLLVVSVVPDVTITKMEVIEALMIHIFVTAPLELWIIWAARRNLSRHGSLRVYWTAFGLTNLLFLVTLSVAMGVAPVMHWYRRSLGARVLTFSFIALTYVVQSLSWYVADWERVKLLPVSVGRRNLKRLMISVPLFLALTIPCVRYLSGQSERPLLAGPAESVQLDGIDDFLTIQNVGFESRSPITLEAWIRPDKPHRGAIASYGPISLTVIAAGDGNRFRLHVSVSEDLVYMLDAKDIFGLDRWTHVAMTYQGSEIRMYVNGRMQEWDVSVYDATSDRVTANRTLPSPFTIADLWPGSQFLIGKIHQKDNDVSFQFSGRIGEVRLNRSVSYHEEFSPESFLTAGSETALLLHLRDGLKQITDSTGKYVATRHR